MLWLILFIISFLLWIIVMITEPRTVAGGFLLLLSALLLGFFMYSNAVSSPEWFSSHLFFHILLDLELNLLIFMLVIYPLVLGVFFLAGGILLLRHEGVNPRNILSVGFAMMLLAFNIVIPLIFNVGSSGTLTYLYWYLTFISMYFVFQLASFSLSGILNTLHFKKDQHFDYVVVLGCAVRESGLTPLLKSRVDKGISVYRDNPGSKLILSGGQGTDEPMPEGRAMAEYVLSRGVAKEDVISEERSASTEENLRFSHELMQGERPTFALVTSSYHVMRSLIIARRLKLRCKGYGAGTKLYFAMNAFLREYAGYFHDSRRNRILHLAILTVIYILFLISQ